MLKQLLLYFMVISVVFISCQKDNDPSVDDHFLNYEVEEIPVTQEYTVGAIYYWSTTFNANITEVPVVGKYGAPGGNVPDDIMQKHIDMASAGGINYFLFTMRSANRDVNNYRLDSVLVQKFLNNNTGGKINFAIAYNFNAGSYGINNNTSIERDANKVEQFIRDFERLIPLFKGPSYQKVQNKVLVYIMNAHQVFSDNNATLYDKVRQRLSAQGVELYLVGMQDRWTPPARYTFRYRGAVDAIFHQSFVSQNGDWDRFHLLPQAMDQNWQYSKKYFKDSLNVDYVPNISPAFNWLILSPNNVGPNVLRNDNGALYKKLCNVAKKNASDQTHLILIDSWNKWDEDTQLEPAESYGNLYLDITKQQFKK